MSTPPDEPGGADASLFAAACRELGVPVHIVPLKKMKNTWDPRWHAAYLLRAPADPDSGSHGSPAEAASDER